MNSRDANDLMMERALTAHRERDARGRLVAPAAWWDLSDEQLEQLFERQREARTLEAALDPEGLSPTARAVLTRILG